MLDPIVTVPVRIRFAGTAEADTFQMIPSEYARFRSDLTAFLSGNGVHGGEYAGEEADHPLVLSLNFRQIAYVEPGKLY